ncbi:asparagine synthase (glutamine-hydrolyzing) [Acidobacteria bacterium AH-259-L09]|nr:asparagine synthase (glutamine-hydrolyzing) [Acidobacteria bacterium AH-259-L09]
MCGIVGIQKFDPSETVDPREIQAMCELIKHRGPDDSGIHVDGNIGLGIRRLSIIDVAGGHQPIFNEDGSLVIAYNGEIYNFKELRHQCEARGHRFRTRTDTETILHLYEDLGPELLTKLNGMFAFAIWDSKKRELFLARDHFGIKPLYYVHQRNAFAFGSEVKALLFSQNVAREVDLEALHQYLTFLWVPDPLTLFRGVYKLPAGHYALLRDGELKIVQYWDLSFPPAGSANCGNEAELLGEIRDRFQKSVQEQMVSDVPIGAFLSAGLDSSSIVAMMSEASSQPVTTYSVTFPPKYRTGEITLDDPSVICETAEHFGCRHTEIVVDPDVVGLLPKLIWHLDEPIADPAVIAAYLVCEAARPSTTVLLSGIGGDELFAGYRKHVGHFLALHYRRLPASIRKALVEPLVSMSPLLRGTSLKGYIRLAKKFLRSASLPSRERFIGDSTYLSDKDKKALYSADLREATRDLNAWSRHLAYFERVAHSDFLNQMLYLDMKAFMVSLNLTYNDKMSMAASVEVRVPFLDREFVEFVAWRVPPALKLKRYTTKYIFRKAMKDILPKAVLRQPKAGFGAPLDHWLSNEIRTMVDDLLSEETIRRRGYFEPAFVQRIVQEQRNGSSDWSLQIWSLLTFELWLRTFIDPCRAGGGGY